MAEILRPLRDEYKDWTPSSGTDHYALVDETSPDEDSTYVAFVSYDYRYEAFGYTSTIASPTGVTTWFRSKYTGSSGTLQHRIVMNDGYGTSALGDDETLTASYADYSYFWDNDADGAEWTKTKIDNAWFGIRGPYSSAYSRTTQAWIVVEEAAGGLSILQLAQSLGGNANVMTA